METCHYIHANSPNISPCPPSLRQMRHELLLLPSISDEEYLACVQFSLILRTAEVVASPPAFLMLTVSECGSGWSGQKANGTLIKDRAGTPSRSLPRSFSVQRFVLWLDALHSQRKEDLGTSRQEKKDYDVTMGLHPTWGH